MKTIEFDVREILADHASIQRTLLDACVKIRIEDQYKAGAAMLTHAMIYSEKRQAAEIDLLYNKNGNVNAAIECADCGSFTTGEYCQCAAEAV